MLSKPLNDPGGRNLLVSEVDYDELDQISNANIQGDAVCVEIQGVVGKSYQLMKNPGLSLNTWQPAGDPVEPAIPGEMLQLTDPDGASGETEAGLYSIEIGDP